MRKHFSRLLALLVCATLLCSATTALAEGLELETVQDGTVEKTPGEIEVVLGQSGKLTDQSASDGQEDRDYPYIQSEPDYDLRIFSDGTIEFYRYHGSELYFTIPDGPTRIGNWAFSNTVCKGVTISSTVTEIAGWAFQRSLIEHITIPGSVKTIGGGAFMNCAALKNVVIEEGTVTLDKMAFKECTALESVSLPGSLTMMGDSAFASCSSLKDVTLGDGLQCLGYAAFHSCGIEQVAIPGSVQTIAQSAFFRCENLKSVELGNGIRTIERAAFQECFSLNHVHIPGSVESIGDEAFDKCYSLDDLKLDEGIVSVGEFAFSGSSNMKGVTIPASITSIMDAAFGHGYTYVPDQDQYQFGKIDGFIIRGEPGTTAEEYAYYWGFEFDDGTVRPTAIAFTAGSSADVELGKTLKLNYTLTPADAVTTVTWSSSNEQVATVSDGIVTPVSKGSALIIATTKNNLSASIDINVIARRPTRVKITNGNKAALVIGKKLKLETKLIPADAETTITWKSSDQRVASVSKNGVVTARRKGVAVIRAITANKKKATIKITVSAPKPTKIQITNGRKATLKAGQKLQLKVRLKPSTAETKLKWKSSDSKVASVSKKGLVKAKAPGRAKITVTTSNNKKATITITVKAA